MKLQFDDNRIPPLPVVATRIMQFDPAGATASSSSMERIIGADQSISSEILRVANSVYYGRSGRIKTLRDAITLMGLKACKNLVILLFTRTMASKIRGELLRKHCIEFPAITALVCIDVAKLTGLPDLKDEAFLCGLLHRIGMTLIALEKRNEYPELIRQASSQMLPVSILEQKTFGITHQEVNDLVARKWNLPSQLSEAILGFDFVPDQVARASHHTRITALSGSVARDLLEIPLLPEEELQRNAIVSHYGLGAGTLAGFSNGYFGSLKENPFYQSAVAVLA